MYKPDTQFKVSAVYAVLLIAHSDIIAYFFQFQTQWFGTESLATPKADKACPTKSGTAS